jgi:hypothetical protein
MLPILAALEGKIATMKKRTLVVTTDPAELAKAAKEFDFMETATVVTVSWWDKMSHGGGPLASGDGDDGVAPSMVATAVQVLAVVTVVSTLMVIQV